MVRLSRMVCDASNNSVKSLKGGANSFSKKLEACVKQVFGNVDDVVVIYNNQAGLSVPRLYNLSDYFKNPESLDEVTIPCLGLYSFDKITYSRYFIRTGVTSKWDFIQVSAFPFGGDFCYYCFLVEKSHEDTLFGLLKNPPR